jgi:HEAT repeat protein
MATTPQITTLGGNAPDAGVDMDVRVEALVVAGRLGDPRIIPQLVQLLGHREVALREAAAWSLGQTRSVAATPPLVTALSDSRASVHALACVGLGRVGDRKALDEAARVMKDTARGPEARAACAYALGLARSAAHVGELTEVVAAGNDEVQVKAAWALGRIGDGHALPALLHAYWARKQAVRDAIYVAVARIGAGGDTSPMPLEDVGLEAGKIDYRALVRSLGAAGAVPPLDTAVLKGRASDVAQGILEALASTGRRDTVVRVLHDLDLGEGFELGVFTRGTPSDPGAAPLAGRSPASLPEMLAVRDAVGTQIAARLDALCDGKDPEIRILALDVLAKLGDPHVPDRIAKALDDEAAPVRLAALGSAQRYLRILGANAHAAAPIAAAAAKHLRAATYQERAAAATTLGLDASAETAPLVAAARS